ncbi:DUF5681 domain-containing protein [Desulfosarcina sp. OttesenSCG-928-A07]|nr:DUF5681 domain-containing protein [Desulfosarcina sp. OttesenSCG-928-G17]MDL2329874.1 DUF5681 domain-containing protein [Desulfosarcina sp. OttesenSCG-928-A07]
MQWQKGQSGNPAGRPKGSVNKQLRMLRDAVEIVLPLVVARALAGDHEAQKLILERGLPKLKPVDVPVEFEMSDADPVKGVLSQASRGELPLPAAKEIIGLLPRVEQEPDELPFINSYIASVVTAGRKT